VLGLDANAAAMVAPSRRTLVAGRGGLPNAAFALAAIERPPAELSRRAHEVTVLFPWGSLFRGIVGSDDIALAGLASLAASGADLHVLASFARRDADALGIDPARLADHLGIAAAWAAHDLELLDHRPATTAEVADSGSSWSSRLRTSPDRTVIHLRGLRGPSRSPRATHGSGSRGRRAWSMWH
jgi:16S rRNA (adenine(1408)-N(1))-methyltransferase